MNDVASAIEEARTEVASASAEFFPDLCNIEAATLVDGGASGDSVSFAPVSSNVPCRVKSLGGGRQIVVGGEAYTITHRLRLPRTSATVAVTPRHRLTVLARGNTAQRVFQHPLVDEDSLDALLWVSAAFVPQGYQQ